MIQFAQTCEAIGTTSSTTEKVRLLAAYFVTVDDVNLEIVARFVTGQPFASSDRRTLAVGGSTILAAAREVWQITDEELSRQYREHGDLGAALAPFTRRHQRLALFADTLAPASLKSLFNQIAEASGKKAGRTRQALCERILAACAAELETKYVVKVMTGDLRIGLREGLVIEAIAAAFSGDSKDVRRAVMASGDVGAAAVAARHGTLAEIAVAYGSAIGFMLASPLQYGSSYRELRTGDWIVESKFDGIRAQLHKNGERILLFSRTFAEISHSYPEIVEAARSIDGSVVLDGEIVARRGAQVLPFRYLQARLQRKELSDSLLREVPVGYACFDILARDDAFLIDEPLLERRKRLDALDVETPHISVAPARPLDGDELERTLHGLFEESRAAGHEGLLVKRLDSKYHPGKRGKWWLKLKRELSTLDVVVIAVEWGHGKRAKVLSDYTFAIRGGDGTLQAIGKAYSGLTDVEIAELTDWFLTHRAGTQRTLARPGEIPVEPKVVIEVAFDVIQRSDLHESGFSLRFPRIVRVRDDKPPEDIDTVERVREIYNEMLIREGLDRG